MKIYRRKKSGTIVLWLLIAALYAGAIFTLADLARDGIKNYTAFFILIPLFLFVPLVLTFFLVGFPVHILYLKRIFLNITHGEIRL